MKKLIVSMKSTDELFGEFKQAYRGIELKKKKKLEHYEISFESERDFIKFIKNIRVLKLILNRKPSSIYELAKICEKDLANIKKTIKFFESIGVVKIEENSSSGRKSKRPVVDYSVIEFDLRAA